MKFYIPLLGDEITLEEDWVFKLYSEGRNVALAEYFGYYLYWYHTANSNEHWIPKSYSIEGEPVMQNIEYEDPLYEEIHNNYFKERESWFNLSNSTTSITITLKKGTILKIDRIYIRKGCSDFSSVTFYVKNLDVSKKKKAFRFWAKLDECNEIIFTK